MATKDGFRLIPSDQAEISAQLESATAWRGEMIRAALVGASAAAVALTFVSLVDPNALLTNATSLLASVTQDGKIAQASFFRTATEVQTSAGARTVADAQASAGLTSEPASNETPANGSIAAPVKIAEQAQAEPSASAEEWLGRFQNWAAHDAQQPETQPAQPLVAEPAPLQTVQENATKPAADSVKAAVQVPRVREARAEIEPERSARYIRRMKRERAEARAEARAEEQAKQDRRDRRAKLRREQLRAQAAGDARAEQLAPVEAPRQPTFLESIGIRQ